MKPKINRLSDFADALTFGGKKSFLSIALISLLIDLGYWIVWEKITGSLPIIHSINLIWWHWSPPFGISRLLDICIIPAFIFSIAWILSGDFFLEYGSELNDIGFFTILDTVISSIVGLFFGAPYVIIAFIVLIPVLICFAAVCYFCIGLSNWNKERHFRRQREESSLASQF